MNKDLIIALLALAFAGSAAALLVVIAKLQQARQDIWDERSVQLSEYKKVIADNELLIEGGKKDGEAIMWYTDELVKARREIAEKQDRLSALLCPTNNHVWKDGICLKCGRTHEDRSD